MSTAYLRLAAALAVVLSAVPINTSAQEARRREGGGRREGGERGERQSESRREARAPRAERQQRDTDRAQVERQQRDTDRAQARRGDVGRDDRQAVRRWPGAGDEARGNRDDRAVPRADVQPRWGDGDRDRDRRRTDDRRADVWRGDRRDTRPRVIVPRYRDYGYRSYPRRTYVVPYGYRPYGYRPGWSVNLYFGRPYGAYVYDRPAYGYYALAPGFAYGSLRIVDAPRDAHVFVDGYYAGVVDDYDGIFQRLNLEPGSHRIEVEVFPDEPPFEFEVRVLPGETVTIHVPRY